ncbi:fluoride efflux transporter FluC [Qipengyuania thermophila]|uniref:fluoride efflux transporter FluC n=1 Tax=Qipengyuania thermophila TaxID=2509361 RepID=UPI0028F45609|nr:CrcB family protein [Qipengyuania thermophila]
MPNHPSRSGQLVTRDLPRYGGGMSSATLSSLAPVALGGALGAVMRFVLGLAVVKWMGPSAVAFPYPTLITNIAGSLLLGVLAGVVLREGAQWHGWSLFLAAGVLGGFTTFSTFSLEVALLIERGAALKAAAYVGTSLLGGVMALFGGLALGRIVA